jgi:competence protein ComEC
MVDKPLQVPIFFTAIGAAFGFYSFHFFSKYLPFDFYVLVLIFLTAGFLCLVNGIVFLRKFLFAFRDKDRFLKELRIVISFLVIGVVLGTVSYTAQMKKASAGIPFEKVLGLSGNLVDDPHLLASGSGAFTFEMLSSQGKDGLEASAAGLVQVYFPETLFESIKSQGRGSKIFIDGSFLPESADNSYANPRFSARSIHVYEDSSWLHAARTKTRMSIIGSFEEQRWGGLALALLLGVRDFLDTEMAEHYRMAGCSHVLALSGMHLGIIAALAAFILKKPLGLRKASGFSAVLIIVYVFIVGAQASLMRAAIMSLLGTFVILKDYPRNMISILSLSFIIQIMLFPASANTVAFMLSYLALAGILLFSPLFVEFFKGWLPDFLANPLASSMAAFLVTSPVLAAFFGTIMPIGIAAALVIVPLSTLFMILSIIWFVVQNVPFLSSLIGKVLDFIYTVLDLMVLQAGKVPGWAVTNTAVICVMCIVIGLILLLAYKQIRKVRMRFVPFA